MLRHFLAMGLALFAIGAPVGGQGGSNDAISLSSQMELVRLVDLAADRLGLRIEYDPKLLQGQAATLRIGSAVTEQELWALTNQLLASRGWAVVQTPGSEAGTLSIVKLSDAAA